MSKHSNVRFRSVGKYVPEKVLTNNDLTEWLDTSDEWITSRTGIKERRISIQENTSDLCSNAAKVILERAGISGKEVGIIIVATMTPDAHSPSVASLVQAGIKAENAMAFDVSAACSGFVYALSIAEKMLPRSSSSYALVIGGEVMSKAVDWSDRSTAVLFGDGAGGVLLEKTSEAHQFFGEDIHTDGSRGEALTSGEKHIQNPFTSIGKDHSLLKMDGRSIFNFVVSEVPKSIRTVVEENHLSLDDVDLFLLHQANARLIQAIAKKLKLNDKKFPLNIAKYGNTSAASLPILLDELVEEGIIEFGKHQTIVLTGFGGGLTWGSLLIRV